MKELNGAELADYIKERQLKSVRSLRQSKGVQPKLAIIVTKEDPAVDKYVALKQAYAGDITAEVEVYRVAQDMVSELLDEMKKDDSVQGVIIQLPLDNPSQTEAICALIPADKDVDSLGIASDFDAATPTAINWLLSGYGIDLVGAKIAIVGQGKLVGKPLTSMFRDAGYDVATYDEGSDLAGLIRADIVITATGQPGLIKNVHIKPGAVVVDAGTASHKGVLVGDVDREVRSRNDVHITPARGGVGPLTVAALFENLITSCRQNAH